VTTSLLSRRDFIVAASAVGGGIALAILPGTPDAASDAAKRSELTPWIVIGADDTVTIRVPGPEAGTGGTTQVCMLVAEELQCDWAQVRAEPISYNRNTAKAICTLAKRAPGRHLQAEVTSRKSSPRCCR